LLLQLLLLMLLLLLGPSSQFLQVQTGWKGDQLTHTKSCAGGNPMGPAASAMPPACMLVDHQH